MDCYLCKTELTEIVADWNKIRFFCYGHDKKIMRCSNCGLVQLVPQWTEDELTALYSKYSEKKDFPGQKPKVKVSKYLTNYVKNGETALEVGCGRGDNVSYLGTQGVVAIGIDKETGTDYRDFKPTEKYDLIYAIHLLEHLPDPQEFIRWAREHGKRFVLEIPCIDDVLMKLPTFRNFCWYPYHLFFFSKKTAIKVCGWDVDVIRRQEYGLINHLRWLLLGRPGNFNRHIPILDDIYKWILIKLGFSDTLIVVGNV